MCGGSVKNAEQPHAGRGSYPGLPVGVGGDACGADVTVLHSVQPRPQTAWSDHRNFVDDPDDVPPDATPFDMLGVELTHHGDHVTFETILPRHHLDDPVLGQLDRIIHEADVGDDLYDAPEAAGLDAIIRGLSLTIDDNEILALTGALFDGLYAWLHRRRG